MRVPPNSPETELALLGAMMANAEACDLAIERLSADDFYVPRHGVVFRAVADMRLAGDAVDPATVMSRLEGDARDAAIAASEADYVISHTSQYVEEILGLSIRRAAIRAGQSIQEKAHDETDPDVVVDEAERLVYSLRRSGDGSGPVAIEDIVKDVGVRVEKGEGHHALRSPWKELDDISLGFSPGSYIIVAARPAQGKTCFALDVARRVAKNDGGVVVFSLEMTKEELVERMLSAESGVPLTRIRSGDIGPDEVPQIQRAIGALTSMRMYIDDSASTMGEVAHRVRRIAPRANLSLVVIDYIQLMTYGSRSKESRVQEVSAMSRAIKLLAREFSVPILVLSQLSRPERKYNDGNEKTPKPTLASLRDSGALEQDADQVIFLYREDEEIPEVTVQVAKNRSGPTGKTTLTFHPICVTFDPT